MRVSSLILRTADIDRAVAFWAEVVGLELEGRHQNFAFLRTDNLALVINEIDSGIADESMTEIVFEVDDPVATFDEMSARGVEFAVELRPVTEDGDRRLVAAHFTDPDGHVASLTGWVEA